jgi:serine/threonine-protein kinase ATR
LLALRRKDSADFKNILAALRATLAAGLSPAMTASIHACHDHLVKLHALYEIEAVSGMNSTKVTNRESILEILERRLEVIGAYTSEKQYLLGVRRATMSLSRWVVVVCIV